MLAGCLSDYSVQSSATGTVQLKPGDRLTGRYYQASGTAAGQAAAAAAAAAASNAASNAAEAKNAQAAERAGRLADLEQMVAADPGNEELWLLFALQHIDLGAVESMQGEPGLFRKAQALLGAFKVPKAVGHFVNGTPANDVQLFHAAVLVLMLICM